jgi:hypothetical protein
MKGEALFMKSLKSILAATAFFATIAAPLAACATEVCCINGSEWGLGTTCSTDAWIILRKLNSDGSATYAVQNGYYQNQRFPYMACDPDGNFFTFFNTAGPSAQVRLMQLSRQERDIQERPSYVNSTFSNEKIRSWPKVELPGDSQDWTPFAWKIKDGVHLFGSAAQNVADRVKIGPTDDNRFQVSCPYLSASGTSYEIVKLDNNGNILDVDPCPEVHRVYDERESRLYDKVILPGVDGNPNAMDDNLVLLAVMRSVDFRLTVQRIWANQGGHEAFGYGGVKSLEQLTKHYLNVTTGGSNRDKVNALQQQYGGKVPYEVVPFYLLRYFDCETFAVKQGYT